jgi:O-succinylbenzoic acid--CoA ligase
MGAAALHFEFAPYRLRLKTPLETAVGTVTERRGWIVGVFDEGGLAGIGEVAPMRRAGTESHRDAGLRIDSIRAAGGALGLAIAEVPGSWEDALSQAYPGLPAFRFGIDLALWDRAARRAGLPLARVLSGGAEAEVEANWLLAGALQAEQVRAALAAGFSVFKMKVGAVSLEQDSLRITWLRELLIRADNPGAGVRGQPSASIRLDANGAWLSVEQAAAAIEQLGLSAVSSIEQPMPVGTEALWGPLQELIPCVAADESVVDEVAAQRLLGLGTVDALVLKPTRLGGLGPCLRIAAAAAEAGVEVWVTTMLESSVGRAACLHLAAALGAAGTRAHGLLTGPLFESDLAESIEGPGPRCLIDPLRPGLGFDLSAFQPRSGSPSAPAVFGSLPPAGSAGSHRELRPGDRLALVTRSSVESARWISSAKAADASVFLIDGRLPAAERAEQIGRTGANLLWDGAGLVSMSDTVASLAGVARREPAGSSSKPPGRELAGLRVFTSGTTGRSRMARLSWAALDSSADAVAEMTGLGPGDLWLCPLPLSHVGGVGVLLRAQRRGARSEFLDRFEPALLLGRIRSGEITHLSLVARMLERLLAGAAGDFGGSALRWVLVGGGSCPVEILREARAAGLPVVATYGLTEAGSTVSLQHPADDPVMPGDAGCLLPHLEMTIGDPDLEGFGEICLRGSSLFGGYEGEPQRPPDAWFETGDRGRLGEEGRLELGGRRGDLIVSGGENVDVGELERLLGARPEVAELGVVGLPDPTWGQRVVAVLRLSDAAQADPGASLKRLSAWCDRSLASWQRPRAWQVVDRPLPRTALGKLKRAELRARFSEEGG